MSEVAATAYWHQFAGRIVPFGSCKIADNTISLVSEYIFQKGMLRQRWSVAREQVRGGANAALSSIDKKVRGATHRGNPSYLDI